MPLIDDSATTQISQLPPDEVAVATALQLQNITDQVNGSPQIYPQLSPASPIPQGLRPGDILVGFNGNNNPQVGIYDGNNVDVISADATAQQMGFAGNTLSGSADPTTTDLPQNGQWAFFTNTSSGLTYLAINQGGTIIKTQLS